MEKGTKSDKGMKRWTVSTNGEDHKIILDNWEAWDGAAELWVDGKLIDSWGSNWGQSPRSFLVGGKEASLQWAKKRCKLYVAGEFISGELIGMDEAEADRDYIWARLRSLGIDAEMAPRGRLEEKIAPEPEEKIAGQFSLGVIDLQGGLIRWVNVRRWYERVSSTTAGQTHETTIEYFYLYFGVPDPKLTSAFPKVTIKLARRRKYWFWLGPVVAVRWEGRDFGLGLLARLNGDRSLTSPAVMGKHDLEIQVYPDQGCWILLARDKKALSRSLWHRYQAIAQHLLTQGR